MELLYLRAENGEEWALSLRRLPYARANFPGHPRLDLIT
jgi:hypothetical protein